MQAMTGIFPPKASPAVPEGPLVLVRCVGGCGLVQLKHAFAPEDMYGSNYGYRSGLNRQMVNHLREKVEHLRTLVSLTKDDVVLDIGSNDGTLLGFYPEGGPKLFGMDPSGTKFKQYYRGDITLLPDFFAGEAFLTATDGQKPRVITSIAMFYDLDHPQVFVDDIARVLHADGIWHFEQSYLPTMLAAMAYDTICHEHSEYYALAQIEYMLERSNLKVVDVSLNDTNGGSFAVTAAHRDSAVPVNISAVNQLRAFEKELNLDGGEPFRAFAGRVHRHPAAVRAAIGQFKKVVGYGASTKGNVLLQYCKLGVDELPVVAEVNPDKYGCVTPGTHIPIVSRSRREGDAAGCDVGHALALPPQHPAARIGVLPGRREADLPAARSRDRVMASDRVAIIVGSGGQDGRLLRELLTSRGERVVGVTRQSLDIADAAAVDALVHTHAPTHVYYLPADHGSSARSGANRSTDASLSNAADAAGRAWATHVIGLIHFCEAVRRHVPTARLFYASSSRIYGDAEAATLDADGARLCDERTPHRPTDLYGITKSAGMSVCAMYRRLGLFCACGILFNHESPLRGESFITQLLARGAAEVRAGTRESVTVGRLAARTDWGWAPEYVDAMTRVLSVEHADDFVIATGKTHRVQDFAEAAFSSVGLDWQEYVVENSANVGAVRPALAGNAAKITHVCGWAAQRSIQEIAAAMTQKEPRTK